MSPVSTYDDVVEKLVVTQNVLSPDELEKARQLKSESDPELPLDQVLLKHGFLTETTYAEIHDLAQASRGTLVSSNDETVDAPKVEAEAKKSESSDSSSSSESSRFAFSEVPTLEKIAVADPTNGNIDTSEAIPITDFAEVEKRFAEASKSARQKRDVGIGRIKSCGRYELVERIARGGMGVVYRARHPDLDREFAVKVLSDGLDADDEAIERFRREAKAAARLNHPGIVKVYDFGTEKGFLYLVMDFVDGQPLDAMIRDQPLSPNRAATITGLMAQALQHAHKQGLVHRDIKPSNVLISHEGQPQLTDFGIVKELGGNAKLTRTGFTLGSPCYMSPEQALGEHDRVGPRSDVYSLGATLYEMLTGRPPFEGDSIHAIMKEVVETEPKSLRLTDPEIPIELESICLKAMAKEPDGRYESARMMGLDLQAFLRGDPVTAKPAGWQTKIIRKARRNREVVFLGILLLLTIFGFLSFFAVQKVMEGRERHNKVISLVEKAAKLRRESDQLARSANQLSLRSQAWQQTATRVRLGYYSAIRFYDEALRLEPSADFVRAERRIAINSLGKNLFEHGQFEFAEFVYGLIDEADMNDKIKARLKFIRAVSLSQRKSDGNQPDFDTAIAVTESRILKCQELGFNTAQFEEDLRRYQLLKSKTAARGKQKVLLENAESRLKANDLVSAFEGFREAFKLGDASGVIRERMDSVRRILEADYNRQDQATARLAIALSEAQNRGSGSYFRESLSRLAALKLSAQKLQRNGHSAHARQDYRLALSEINRAFGIYDEACALAEATIAHDNLNSAKELAREAQAEKYAKTDFAKAKAAENEGLQRFNRKEYREAIKSFETAQKHYSVAQARSSERGGVFDLRRRSRELSESAFNLLPRGFELRDYKRALAQRKQGAECLLKNQIVAAEECYSEACRLLQRVIKAAPTVTAAVEARKTAQAMYDKAKRNWAEQYAQSNYQRGENIFREGLGALKLEQFETAKRKFESAEYNFKKAVLDSNSTANLRRKAEKQQAAMMEARKRAIDQGKEDTFAFKAGESSRIEGENASRKERWYQANQHFEAALKSYQRARGI